MASRELRLSSRRQRQVGIRDSQNTSKVTTYQPKALDIEADMQCYVSDTSAYMVRSRCTNKERIEFVVSHFRDRGYNVFPSNDAEAATIKIEESNSPKILSSFIMLLHFLSIGFIPYYEYTSYSVVYSDPAEQVKVERDVSLSTTQSWFNVFRSNPDNIEGRNWRKDVEYNLIRKVLDEAEVGRASAEK